MVAIGDTLNPQSADADADPAKFSEHHTTRTLHHAPLDLKPDISGGRAAFHLKRRQSANEDFALLVLFSLYSSLPLHVRTPICWCRCVVPLLFKTVPLCAAVTPLRCPLDSVVTPRFISQERLRDTMSHPDFSPNSPQRGVKSMPSMTAALHQLRIFVMCLVESLAALFHLIYSLLSFFFFFREKLQNIWG